MYDVYMNIAFVILMQLFGVHPLAVPPIFGTFGNTTLPDCQYAAAANLVIAEFPQAQINAAEVEGAYDTYGVGWISPYWAGDWYLVNVGFDGYKANSVTTIDEGQVEAAANNGGVEVKLWEQALGGAPGVSHDIDIISATPSTLTVVNSWYGTEQIFTWSQWNMSIAPSVITYSAVTW